MTAFHLKKTSTDLHNALFRVIVCTFAVIESSGSLHKVYEVLEEKNELIHSHPVRQEEHVHLRYFLGKHCKLQIRVWHQQKYVCRPLLFNPTGLKPCFFISPVVTVEQGGGNFFITFKETKDVANNTVLDLDVSDNILYV